MDYGEPVIMTGIPVPDQSQSHLMAQPAAIVGGGYPMQQQPMMDQNIPTMVQAAPQAQQPLLPGTIITSPDGKPMVVGPNGVLQFVPQPEEAKNTKRDGPIGELLIEQDKGNIAKAAHQEKQAPGNSAAQQSGNDNDEEAKQA